MTCYERAALGLIGWIVAVIIVTSGLLIRALPEQVTHPPKQETHHE